MTQYGIVPNPSFVLQGHLLLMVRLQSLDQGSVNKNAEKDTVGASFVTALLKYLILKSLKNFEL